MATSINFPDNPSQNDTYSYGNVDFIFNGTTWEVILANTLSENVDITDAGDYFVSDNVEDTLQEIGADLDGVSLTSSGLATEYLDGTGTYSVPGVTDGAVTYAKLGTEFVTIVPVTASDMDWSAGIHFTKTITADLTLTFSNLEVGKTVALTLTGDYVLTLPTYVNVIDGTYDGTVDNLIQFYCADDTTSAEIVWCIISQEA